MNEIIEVKIKIFLIIISKLDKIIYEMGNM